MNTYHVVWPLTLDLFYSYWKRMMVAGGTWRSEVRKDGFLLRSSRNGRCRDRQEVVSTASQVWEAWMRKRGKRVVAPLPFQRGPPLGVVTGAPSRPSINPNPLQWTVATAPPRTESHRVAMPLAETTTSWQPWRSSLKRHPSGSSHCPEGVIPLLSPSSQRRNPTAIRIPSI